MSYKKGIFLSFILFFTSLQLLAQDTALQMKNVVITATQVTQLQKESGRNIITIKGETFSSLPVHSIDDLLRYIPGIEIQQRGPQGSQSDIIIRGGTFQQVLIIIDGIKINDPLTGHFSTYIPIHPSEIDRIEILKGAASAIWGSEAVGGVVNIITKTFSGNNKKKSFKAKTGFGEYKLLTGDAWFNRANKNSNISGGVLTNNSQGQPLRGTKGFFHLTTGTISYSQNLAKNWKINFRTAIDLKNFNAQNFYTTFTSDTAKEEINTWWNHLNIIKKTGKGQLNFDAALKKLRDQYSFRPGSIPNDNKSGLFTSQLFYTSQLNKQNNYTIGIQTHRKEIRSNDRGNHSLWHGAIYSIFRHRAGKDFFINESVRLDWDENYGTVLLPQINFAWTPSKLTIRGSAGKSFRDADFTERYNNYNKALVTSGRIGNPDLKAEQSWNAEIGADYNFSSHIRISSTIFYRAHSDLIDWANTLYNDMPRKINLSPAGSYALAKNVEFVKTTGAEIDFLYSKQLTQKSILQATLGFTWLQSKNDEAIPSFYISSHAKYLVNFSTVYKTKDFSISINGLYKKREPQKSAAINAEITPSYFILNVKAGYSVPWKSGNIFMQADNLFDKMYSDLLGSIMPRRWISGGFEITL